MTETMTDVTPPHPAALDAPHGTEGSATCCHILLLLHKHSTHGLPAADLQLFLGLSRTDLDQALRGLRLRYRITFVGGRGTAGRWMLQQHAGQHAQDECA